MTITVYHVPDDLTRDIWMTRGPEHLAMVREHFPSYKAVAKVQASDLDDAYRLTNTIDGPWWENRGVEFLGSAEHGMDGCRSTSIGDVLELDGRKYIVAPMGFTDFDAEAK